MGLLDSLDSLLQVLWERLEVEVTKLFRSTVQDGYF